MYIAPRPLLEDDPLFPVRVTVAAGIGVVAALLINTAVPVLFPAVCFAMVAGQRLAFNPPITLVGPIVMAVLMVLMSLLITFARPMPLALLSVLFLIFWGAYYLILKTGNPLGMVVLIVAVLTSTMGMYSLQALDAMTLSCLEACALALVIMPVLYYFFPPKTTAIHAPVYAAAEGDEYAKRAFIRASVMMLLTFWLYTALDVTNLIYAIAAIFVTVFPTRSTRNREVKERVFATTLGGVVAVAIITIFNYVSHPLVALLALLGSGLLFADKMMHGRYQPMVYQFAFSVTLALVVGALTSQSSWDAVIARIGLTLAGALSAALLTSLLEYVFLKERPQGDKGQSSIQPSI